MAMRNTQAVPARRPLTITGTTTTMIVDTGARPLQQGTMLRAQPRSFHRGLVAPVAASALHVFAGVGMISRTVPAIETVYQRASVTASSPPSGAAK